MFMVSKFPLKFDTLFWQHFTGWFEVKVSPTVIDNVSVCRIK